MFDKQLELWMQNCTEDPDIPEELMRIHDQNLHAEINDRFYRGLSFGTGGLRGRIGAGPNRMNVYTVGQATQGLARYLAQSHLPPKVAIAYDSRIKSKLFAIQAARVLAANNIVALVFPTLAPTPALSFAVRHHKCGAGICITASHNPAEYNGYKVYDREGCQITDDAAIMIENEMRQADIFAGVKRIAEDEALSAGTISYIPQDTIDTYLAAVLSLRVDALPNDSLKVVYTPLNGTGLSYVQHVLQQSGVKELQIVQEQSQPDGLFPSCPYPNPEEPAALRMGIQYCRQLDADLLLATDPDCDRVGVAVKNQAEYTILSGNEVGILLLDYLCRTRRENGTMPQNPVVVKSIVTTEMAAKVAAEYGVETINVLTGFKYIGEQIHRLERMGATQRFAFGFEESCGYLSGDHVRDKDGVNASLLICDMAQKYKEQGKTLVQAMEELYVKYGFYLDHLDSYTLEGEQGLHNMRTIMKRLRSKPLTQIGCQSVVSMVDYQRKEGIHAPVPGLPSSNVLQYVLDSEAVLTIRPSGTEPKIKVYYSVKGMTRQDAVIQLNELRVFTDDLLT